MREIKFRAWNFITKSMIDLKQITPLAINMDVNGLFIPFSDELHLMQFTGLHDRNGKEIYEGDIVKLSIYTEEEPTISEVEWTEIGGFCVDYNDGEADFFMIGDFPGTIEVIGNIYENAELAV